MSDQDSTETKIASLSKKIDDQSRYTRVVILVCTTAVVAAQLYIAMEIFSTLPAVMMAAYMNNMNKIINQRASTGTTEAPNSYSIPGKSR